MDRDELKKLFGDYWRFAREYVHHRGDFEKSLAKAEVHDVGVEVEICRGLKFFDIDPLPFWDFHNLIWNDLIPKWEGGELEDEPLRALRASMHRAWLSVMLLQDDAQPLVEPIEEDIAGVRQAVGCRLVTTEILSALAKNKAGHGDSTVKLRLALMVKQKKLSNKNDGKGRGYGLPDWG